MAIMFILFSAKHLNILYVTPGVETIPAPTIDTLATLSLKVILLQLKFLLFFSISLVFSKSLRLIVNVISVFFGQMIYFELPCQR